MPVAFPIRGQWQFDTPKRRLALALAASLAFHLAAYVTWRVSPAIQSWTRSIVQRVLPAASTPVRPEAAASKQASAAPEVPLTFVEVDPALAAPEPPKETKFYSTQNSLAANPEPARQSDMPKIDGREKRVLRMLDNPKPNPQPLQPTPPKNEPETKPETKPGEQAETKPKPPPPIGDLAMLKTDPARKPPDTGNDEPKPRTKPRTLREAMQRNPSLAGQKSLQEGGVQRRAHIAMVDAKGSPFGDYDYAFIRAVEQHWYELLDNKQYLMDRQGAVVLTFRLHYDGRISDMEVQSNGVGDILGLLCQKAIIDPAPFPKWPAPMRQAIHADTREVKFTFYYD